MARAARATGAWIALVAALGLLLGGVVHIVAILTLPDVAPNDAGHRIARHAEPLTVTVLPDAVDGIPPLPELDPFFLHAACPYAASDLPVRIEGILPRRDWSVAVLDERGTVLYSVNDRASVAGRLDVVAGPPAALEALRLGGGDLEGAELAAVSERDGFFLVRVFAPSATERSARRALLEALSCSPF